MSWRVLGEAMAWIIFASLAAVLMLAIKGAPWSNFGHETTNIIAIIALITALERRK